MLPIQKYKGRLIFDKNKKLITSDNTSKKTCAICI